MKLEKYTKANDLQHKILMLKNTLKNFDINNFTHYQLLINYSGSSPNYKILSEDNELIKKVYDFIKKETELKIEELEKEFDEL